MAKAKAGMRKIIAPVTLVVSAGKNRTKEVPPGTEIELPEAEADQIEAHFASGAPAGPELKPGEVTAPDSRVEALESAVAALSERVAVLEGADVTPTEVVGEFGAPGTTSDPAAAG